MKRALSLLCVMMLLFPLAARAEGDCASCRALFSLGFPWDYCERLCPLKRAHPSWRFRPLLLPELCAEEGGSAAFFDIVSAESAVPERNLVFSSEAFLPYAREGESGDARYRFASEEAIAYLMDPRNFLFESGVFQFLCCSEGAGAELTALVLAGTVAAPFATEVASASLAYGLDPAFFAVRLVQEQGRDGNALWHGTAGESLAAVAPSLSLSPEELASLDGVYNPLNVSASGKTSPSSVLAGARHARDRGWNSLEKGLMGGAEKLAREYLACYQDTLYLQKWNVDPRSRTPEGKSRNFWGQYMQSISAPVTESARLYEAYAAAGLLDLPLSFSVPVYEDLPVEPVPDPAEGACELLRSETLPHLPCFEREEALPAPSPETPLPETEEKKEARGKKSAFGHAVTISAAALALFLFLCPQGGNEVKKRGKK